MADSAASPVRSFRPQPFVPAQVARRIQPVGPQQLTEPEPRRLARQLHDGPVQEVLAAGLAIDSCLAEMDTESLLRPGLEQARRLTATALRQLRSLLQSLRDGADLPIGSRGGCRRGRAVRAERARFDLYSAEFLDQPGKQIVGRHRRILCRSRRALPHEGRPLRRY